MKGAKRRAKADATGRNSDRVGSHERFFSVRRSILHSPQYSALSPNARALLFEFAGLFNGSNLDNIFLSVSDAGARLGLSDLKAVTAAFNELESLGFIRQTIASVFRGSQARCSKARAWRLMVFDNRGKAAGPDHLSVLDFDKLTEKQKRRVARRSEVLKRYLKDYSQGKFAVEDSSILSVRREMVVEDSSMLNSGNGEKPPIRLVEDSSIHIEYHRGVGIEASASTLQSAWWQSVERCLSRQPPALSEAA